MASLSNNQHPNMTSRQILPSLFMIHDTLSRDFERQSSGNIFRKCFCHGSNSAGSALAVRGKLSYTKVSFIITETVAKVKLQKHLLFSSLAVADLLVAILVMPLGAVKEVGIEISNIKIFEISNLKRCNHDICDIETR